MRTATQHDRVSDCLDLAEVAAEPATLHLAPEPFAVRRARALVAERCAAARLDADVTDTAVLLTSEVVTNAVVHGRSSARLTVALEPGGVLVEVGDDNSRPPRMVEQDREALDGRGMPIVDALAHRWGVCRTGQGKVVWFEVHAGPSAYDRAHG